MNDFKLNIYPNGKIYSAEFIEGQRKQIKEQGWASGTSADDFAIVTGIRGDESRYEFLKKYAVLCHGSETADYKNKYSKPYFDETFHWIENKVSQMSEVEFWKAVALSNIYWEIKYENMYHEK